jgi:hypothetical protein
MPVIPCPDCNREVSTLAPACPHCGRPAPGGPSPLAAPPAMAQAAEETLWRGTPSPIVLVGRAAGIVAALVLIPLITRFFANNGPDLDAGAQMTKIGWWVTAIVAGYLFVRLLMVLTAIRSTLYTITSQRVMIEQGLLSKSLAEIDLRYVDESQFHQSVLDRLLGIGNVILISSDKTMPTYALRGIRDPRTVRETIRSHAYQVSQRQLFTRAT